MADGHDGVGGLVGDAAVPHMAWGLLSGRAQCARKGRGRGQDCACRCPAPFEMRWKETKTKTRKYPFKCFVVRSSGKELEVGVVGSGCWWLRGVACVCARGGAVGEMSGKTIYLGH